MKEPGTALRPGLFLGGIRLLAYIQSALRRVRFGPIGEAFMGENKRTQDSANSATFDALGYIALASGFGLAASIIYGANFSLTGAILAGLASVLGYAVGGLGGFLFGFPRYTDNAAISSVEDLKRAVANGRPGAATASPVALNANTNLERIVDWLMTIIVGAALVNIRDMISWGSEFSRQVTQAVQAESFTNSGMPGALLILPFMIGGFLHLYLWARRYLLEEWAGVDQAIRKFTQEVKEVKEAVAQEVQEVKKAASQQLSEVQSDVDRLKARIWPVGPASLQRISESLKAAKAPSAVIDDILKRYREADSWESEPFQQFAEPKAGPFELSATAKSIPGNRFEVHLDLRRSDNAPAEYAVAWLLHNTFDEPVIVQSGVDKARGYDIWIDEDFIVAALVIEKSDEGNGTSARKLALDLSSLEVFRKPPQDTEAK
jgi:hypothetical protein